MLKLKNVWVKYGKKAAVRKLSLSVKKGAFVTILGANGAGKTTTIKMLCTLISPTSGDAFVNRYSVTKNQRDYRFLVGLALLPYPRPFDSKP